MATIHEIRETIDSKLDKWEADATALEAQLSVSKEKAVERLEAQKRKFAETLAKFKAEIEKSPQIAETTKNTIKTHLDHLQVQLALGKAEAKDAYESQKEKIKNAIKSFVASADQEIGDVSEAVTKELIAAEDALDAELEALAAQFEMEKASQQAKFNEKKEELAAKIQRLKNDLKEKKLLTGEKLTACESDVSSGLAQIKKAFSDLVS